MIREQNEGSIIEKLKNFPIKFLSLTVIIPTVTDTRYIYKYDI